MSIKRAIKISLLTILAVTFITGTALSQSSAPTSSPASAPTEDPAVTRSAKTLYAEIMTGNVDRSHLSADVNSALTDSTLKTLASQLGSLGPPTWQYVKQLKTPLGNVSIYKLVYPNISLYMTFGATSAGTVYDVSFVKQLPPG
jgi:hypothetical protein